MRKYAFILTLVLSLAFVGCKKSSPVPEMIELMNKTTEKIEQAKNTDEVSEISTQFAADLEKLKEDYPDYQPTEEEKNQIVEASIRMATASSHAFIKEIPASASGAMRTATGSDTPADNADSNEIDQ